MNVLRVIFAVSTVVCGMGWLSTYIALEVMTYLFKKNGYPTPTSQEVDECTQYVAKKMFKF